MATKQYSHDYIEKAFYTWYENDRPGVRRLSAILKDDNGKSPSTAILDTWQNEFGWTERADALDAQLSVIMDTNVIDKRMKMFEEHARVGEMIINRGKEYFENHKVDDANSAIRAITAGVEIQRISVGNAEAYAKISQMTDAQIVQELKKLTGKTPSQENEFTVDADVDVEDVGEITNDDTESNEVT